MTPNELRRASLPIGKPDPSPAPQYEGHGRQGCCYVSCPFSSIPGLTAGNGACPYHWAHFVWGKAWADQCYPDYTARAEAARQAKRETRP